MEAGAGGQAEWSSWPLGKKANAICLSPATPPGGRGKPDDERTAFRLYA